MKNKEKKKEEDNKKNKYIINTTEYQPLISLKRCKEHCNRVHTKGWEN